MNLETKPRVNLLISNSTFQGFDFDLCNGGLEHPDLFRRGWNGGRIKPSLFGRHLVEALKELDDEVVAL